MPVHVSRGPRTLIFAATLAGVFAVASQASAQVVIRERVEVPPRQAPPRAALGPSASVEGGVALCGEPAVGTVRYEALRGPSLGIHLSNHDLATTTFPGSLLVATGCGGGQVPLALGFVYGDTWEDHDGDGIHRHLFGLADSVVVFEMDLKPLDSIADRVQIPEAGLDWVVGSGWALRFGCANGSSCAESPYSVAGGEFGIQRVITGGASGAGVLQPDWPEEIVCGTTVPVPFVATQGTTSIERWLDPAAASTVLLAQESNQPTAARAGLVLSGGSTPSLRVDTDYASVRMGQVLLVAPPCAQVPQGRGILVKGTVGGREKVETVRLIPPSPVALDLSAERDTLRVSGPVGSRIRATAILADSTVTMMDPTTTPITFTAVSEWLEVRQENVQQGGPTRTLPYVYSGGDDASVEGVVVRVPFAQRSGPGPVCDTQVEVTASGGGVSGTITVVVAGHSTATAPDSLRVEALPNPLASGERATISASGLTVDGCDVALPDTTRTAVMVSGEYHGLLEYEGEQAYLFRDVPFGDLQSGLVEFVSDSAAGCGETTVLVEIAGAAGSTQISILGGANGGALSQDSARLGDEDSPCSSTLGYGTQTKAEIIDWFVEACPAQTAGLDSTSLKRTVEDLYERSLALFLSELYPGGLGWGNTADIQSHPSYTPTWVGVDGYGKWIPDVHWSLIDGWDYSEVRDYTVFQFEGKLPNEWPVSSVRTRRQFERHVQFLGSEYDRRLRDYPGHSQHIPPVLLITSQNTRETFDFAGQEVEVGSWSLGFGFRKRDIGYDDFNQPLLDYASSQGVAVVMLKVARIPGRRIPLFRVLNPVALVDFENPILGGLTRTLTTVDLSGTTIPNPFLEIEAVCDVLNGDGELTPSNRLPPGDAP